MCRTPVLHGPHHWGHSLLLPTCKLWKTAVKIRLGHRNLWQQMLSLHTAGWYLQSPNSTEEKPGSRCHLIAWAVLHMPLLTYFHLIQTARTEPELTMGLSMLKVSSLLGSSSRYLQNGAPWLSHVDSISDNRGPQCHVGDKVAIIIQGCMSTTVDCFTPDLRLSTSWHLQDPAWSTVQAGMTHFKYSKSSKTNKTWEEPRERQTE